MNSRDLVASILSTGVRSSRDHSLRPHERQQRDQSAQCFVDNSWVRTRSGLRVRRDLSPPFQNGWVNCMSHAWTSKLTRRISNTSRFGLWKSFRDQGRSRIRDRPICDRLPAGISDRLQPGTLIAFTPESRPPSPGFPTKAVNNPGKTHCDLHLGPVQRTCDCAATSTFREFEGA